MSRGLNRLGVQLQWAARHHSAKAHIGHITHAIQCHQAQAMGTPGARVRWPAHHDPAGQPPGVKA